ncbi:hypothetical protein EJP77_17420 [Paenibacillus zeisoli]|uniref:Uncharacterized protein n=1 Tax=Paenibacillus zeisoli TaxID=2496267 RepID=A0A433X2V0_9BACL|nr:hypothetical protein [Paenibacillus zeisoli]RUT28397.1 hypothetical protein EJP77_17420 [Paenibacillus zeisoli]
MRWGWAETVYLAGRGSWDVGWVLGGAVPAGCAWVRAETVYLAGRGTWDVSSVHGGAVHAGCAGAGQRLFTWRDVAHGMWAGCWEALSLRDALGLEQRLFTWRDVALGM